MSEHGFAAGAHVRRLAPEITARVHVLQGVRPTGLHESTIDGHRVPDVGDAAPHIDALACALWADEQVLFDDHVAWAKVLYFNRGVPLERLVATLSDVRAAVVELAPQDVSLPAGQMMDRALAGFESYPTALTSRLAARGSVGELGLSYLGAALSGDRMTASRIVLDAADSGVPIRDIYILFFQETLRELGRLWQSNMITVAQEHLATEVTHMAMGRLYSYVSTPDKGPNTIVVACVGGERHALGMRMVADFFEMSHWETFCVGADTPANALIETVDQVDADILALSVTMANGVPETAQVIGALRADPRTADVQVLVGGYPFNLAPRLWETVGADGYAPNATEAVHVAESLVSS